MNVRDGSWVDGHGADGGPAALRRVRPLGLIA